MTFTCREPIFRSIRASSLRCTRLFFDLIAIANGYGPIDYARALQDDPEVDNNCIRASIDSVQRADFKLLQSLIEAGLIRNENLA